MPNFKNNFENFLKDKNENKEFKDKRYYLNEQTQEKILDIQEEKLLIVAEMKDLLHQVGNNESISFSEHARSVSQEGDNFIITKKGGVKETITKGDILVAGMNGFDIRLDANVDRLTKKQFILQETTRKIKNLYNKQLIYAETENINSRPGDGAVEAYRAIEERLDESTYENKQHGILAEQMVESFMTKIIANNPNLPFTIDMADVYDDVRRKMDFKLHIKKDFTRGVAVDAGVQFTLNHDKTEFKQNQIEKVKQFMNRNNEKTVDDLVLVTMSLNEIESSLQNWKEQGKQKSIAGPAEHWSPETQKQVFTAMLEKLPEHLHIQPEKLWEDIQNKNT